MRASSLDLVRGCHLNYLNDAARHRNNNKTSGRTALDFALPADLVAYLAELDQFIAREIKPIEAADDNIRFFDHRPEWARTDFENGGLPRHECQPLPRRVQNLPLDPRHPRFPFPQPY